VKTPVFPCFLRGIAAAELRNRMIAVLTIIGFVVAGLVVGFSAMASAPVGFQDENGFHFGPDQDRSHEEFASGVSQLA
jgi:hypothetical protein